MMLLPPTEVAADWVPVSSRVYFPFVVVSDRADPYPAPAPEPTAVPPSVLRIGAHLSGGSSCQYLLPNAPVRAWARWDLIEPTPGEYNWAALDYLVNACTGHELMIGVTNSPTWARRVDLMRLPSAEPAPEHYADYVHFVQLVYDRYLPDIIEVWNEPDVEPSLLPDGAWWMGAWGWTYLDGVRYGTLANMVAQALPADVKVIIGALHLENVEFARGMLATALDYQGVSYHAYDKYIGFTAATVWKAKLSTMTSLTSKPLYVTETALVTDPGAPTSEAFELAQAGYLEIINNSPRPVRIYWFPLAESGSSWRNEEMVMDGRRKPVWFAWEALYAGNP